MDNSLPFQLFDSSTFRLILLDHKNKTICTNIFQTGDRLHDCPNRSIGHLVDTAHHLHLAHHRLLEWKDDLRDFIRISLQKEVHKSNNQYAVVVMVGSYVFAQDKDFLERVVDALE